MHEDGRLRYQRRRTSPDAIPTRARCSSETKCELKIDFLVRVPLLIIGILNPYCVYFLYYIAIGDKRYSSLITNALLFLFSGEMCTGAMCTGAMCTGAMCTSEICTDEMYW